MFFIVYLLYSGQNNRLVSINNISLEDAIRGKGSLCDLV